MFAKISTQRFGTLTRDSFKPETHGAKFVITESLFSMNGTIPNLKQIGRICSENNAFLIVDEAHAIGVFGQNGNGLQQC